MFSFNIREAFQMNTLKDNDYMLMCYEFNKMVNSYEINQDLYSNKLWKYLSDKYKINGDNNVLLFTETDVDEKNHLHKIYKYHVKCDIDNQKYFYMIFLDEARGYEDDDYNDFVTEEDKENKISNLIIYYDSDKISSQYIEDTIVSEILKFGYLPTNKNQFFTITTNQFGFTLKSSYIKDIEVDLELNYGKGFTETHEKILDKLKNKKHGLFLFHGEPGTGKTFYIRKLIRELSEDKLIIYVPTYMMQSIADPEFISFISSFKNSILLLEDSENILANTIDDRTQAVSNILNMTDGLLNDCMDIQIITTFNTNAKMIDKALTRAGRLQVNYKFKKLSKENANILAKHIGIDRVFTEAATLAEIYEGANQLIEDDLETKKIGF